MPHLGPAFSFSKDPDNPDWLDIYLADPYKTDADTCRSLSAFGDVYLGAVCEATGELHLFPIDDKLKEALLKAVRGEGIQSGEVHFDL